MKNETTYKIIAVCFLIVFICSSISVIKNVYKDGYKEGYEEGYEKGSKTTVNQILEKMSDKDIPQEEMNYLIELLKNTI